ncbi:MAG: photosystem I reaction center subunit XII [Gammaproteobacteria bacterium]
MYIRENNNMEITNNQIMIILLVSIIPGLLAIKLGKELYK